MIVVKGSSPLVITVRLNSMEEVHYYKVKVVGSNPTAATNRFAALWQSIRLLTGGSGFDSLRAYKNG
jgi:hypothetical protein